MGRAPCCDKANVKKGPWSPEEDSKLKDYIHKFGTGGNWITLPHKAGLKRCGKSCRLRWLNYLRPDIKHGEFSDDEDRIILNLFASIGSRWSIIASQLPGRTDNDIKNYWNTKLKKKLMAMMVPPVMSHDHRLKPSTILQFPSPTSSYQTLPSQQPLSLSSSFLRSDNTNSCPFYDSPNNIDFLTSQFGTFQPQEGNLVNPMQIQGITSSSSLTMKLLDQSSSSLMFSDPIKQERVDFQNSSCSGFDQSQTDDQWTSHNNALLDYHLEDVKRLIGSSNSGSGHSNFFSTDNGENRSEEEILSMYNF